MKLRDYQSEAAACISQPAPYARIDAVLERLTVAQANALTISLKKENPHA